MGAETATRQRSPWLAFTHSYSWTGSREGVVSTLARTSLTRASHSPTESSRFSAILSRHEHRPDPYEPTDPVKTRSTASSTLPATPFHPSCNTHHE